LWFAVNVVVTVLATLAIGVGAYSGTVRALHPTAALKPATSPTPSIPSAASPSPQPMPTPPLVTPRLAVEDIDLVDASTGWVLLTSCNAATSAKCQYVVAATADGGDSWTKPAQVGSLFAPSDGSGPRHVRFANRLDGFVYGYSGAFVTHDGGNTWNSAGLPAQFVYDIAIGGRTAWAVTQPCPKGSFCQFEVRSSIDGGRTWSPPHSLPQNFDPVIAAVGFDSGVVLGSLPVTGMEVTSDGGKTWRSIKTQCTGSPNGESIATSDGKELWELCFAPAGRTLFVSADGGKSWSQRATPRPSPAASPVAIPAWFISNRSHVAFMQGFPQPYVTRDGGVTWNPVGSDQIQFGTMKFAGPVNGWALDTGMNLWVTTNGGDSWSQAAALPSDAGQ
jgi:photosystem II stability/assembly factor-like uncharacterized protein